MVSGVVLGGLLGLTVQLYSNAVRKLPLMRHPWEHVLWTGKDPVPAGWRRQNLSCWLLLLVLNCLG